MNLDEYKGLDVSVKDETYSLEISYDHIEQEFSEENRILVLHSKVKYSTNLFDWEATIPTVRIPYRDPSVGFLLNGVIFSSVGIYQRAPGVVISKDTDESATGNECIDIVTSRNTTFSIAYRRHGIHIIFNRGGKDRPVPIGVFLKALSGLPYSVILQRFAFKPPALRYSFPCEVAARSVDLAKVASYGIDSDEEPSIDDCVNAVFRAINQFDSNAQYSTHWKLTRIRAFFNSLHFKSEQNYETVLSVHSRAIGTYLDQDLKIPIYEMDKSTGMLKVSEFSLPRGTFINEEVAAQLRWYDVSKLRVRSERSYLLQEDTPYLFRAKGYTLVDDVPECGLRAGTLIGEEELKLLNQQPNVKLLDVNSPTGKKVIARSGKETDTGDFITLLNTLFTCPYKQFNESSQYELANRVVINYDKQVALEIEQTYQDIVSGLGGCQQLQNILQSLPKLPSNRLAEHLRNSDNKEIAQADITNVLSRAIAEDRASALMREAPAAMTGIQLGQYGRVDSLHAPESDKVGAVQELTIMANVNQQTGEIETPYERIIDGHPTGQIEYVSAAKEKGKYIVGWDEKFEGIYVQARYNGDVTTVSKEQVSYRDVSPFCDMSVSRMLIPFPEFSQPRRSLMASKMMGQAVPLLFPERPLVSTGGDMEIPCLYYTARSIIESSLGADKVVERELMELVNVNWGKSFAMYTCLHNGTSFVFPIPFTGTDKETLYSYNLNFKEGNKYQLDDIVFYNQSCDINEYDMVEYVEQGAVPLIQGSHRPALALGINLRVGFKTYSSSTVDDAMVINSRLVKNRKFSSIQIFKYDYELRADESFNFSSSVPRLHSHVYAGTPVISAQRKTDSGVKEKHILADEDGEAIYVHIDEAKRSAEVWVAGIHDATLGDKGAGRHGNKSVIARIVPEELMPYDPVTGESLDAILNPLGIPSRMNNGQLLEATLAYVMEKEGKHAVVTPFYPSIKQEITRLYEGAGFGMKKLYNPIYGKFTERPIFVGNMYFLKLEQMSNLKWAAVGAPRSVDPVFGQPIDSATEFKGQAVSEMETWAFAAAGAKTILNNLFSLYSSDVLSRNKYFEILSYNEDNGEMDSWDEIIGGAVQRKVDNKNALATQTVMRMFGQELVTVDNHYEFLPLRLGDITAQIIPLDLKNHSEPVTENEWCKVKLQAPVVNPFWIRNFPLNLVLGVKSVKMLVEGKHYLDVFNRQTKPATELDDFDKVRYITGISAVIALLRNTTVDEAIARLSNKGTAEDLAQQGVVMDNFEEGQSEVINPEEQASEFDDVHIEVPVNVAGLIQFLQRMKTNGIELSDLVWDYLPIMPKVFRQTTVVRGKEHEHSFQKQLRRICDCSESQDIYNGLEALIGYGTQKKDDLMSLRGYFFGKDSQSGQHGKIRSAVLSQRVGFSGRTVIIPATDPTMSPYCIGIPWRVAMIELAEVLAIRMQKRAAEMTAHILSEMNINIPLGDIKRREWEKILRSLGEYSNYVFGKYFDVLDHSDRLYLYNYFRSVVKDICEQNVSKDGQVYWHGSWEFPENLPADATIDAMVVTVGRQPTLHKRSIRCFFGILVDGYCIQIHPLICSGFNADFDGDTMWNVQLFGEMKTEGWRTISVLQDLISEKDGSYTLTISQDAALGLFCATIFKDNTKTFQGEPGAFYFYSDPKTLRLDLEYGKLKYYDVVIYRNDYDTKSYISTAGRILVNAMVPGALTALPFKDTWGICEQTLGKDAIGQFCELKYDMVWTTTSIVANGYTKGAKIGSICLNVCHTYGPRTSVNTTQSLYEIGLACSDLYGVSASMDDLSVDVDVAPLMVQPAEYVNKLNTLKQLGLVSEDERKDAAIRAWERMHKQASDMVVSALPPNSNLHYLMYSGARGKPGQIMQSIGFIGTISKTVAEDIEYPILRGYGNGLKSLDLFQACYPTRIGLVSTQTGTKDTGYATRQTVYMSSGMEIVEDDCGISNWTADVGYDYVRAKVLWPDGKTTAVDDLLGEMVDPAWEGYVSVMTLVARKNYMLDEELLEHLLSSGFEEIHLLDGVVKITRALSPGWRQQALEEGYSYALPYTENRKVTEKTLDWIERYGLARVIMFDKGTNENDGCFDREAYIPVDYNSEKFTLYLNGDKVEEEMVYGRTVSLDSPGSFYYSRLLDENNALTVRAFHYITERKLRLVRFEDGSELTIKYEITALFKELVLGCRSVGMLGLDAEDTITTETLKSIVEYQFEAIPVRSELTCLSTNGVCSVCHGKSLTTDNFAPVGTNLGIAAAQAQCEPLSQSTLNVTHSGGKRSAGVGLVSGLGYYMRMLQGRLVSKKTQDALEDYTKVSGYVKKNLHDERFFQIVDENDEVLESWTLNDAGRCCVPDGAYVDAGTKVKDGWPQLDRHSSRDIFKSALQTRYLLLQEYRRIFESLDVSPKTYSILAREQTSICYLDKDINYPVTKDCSVEIQKPTNAYKLIVSPQAQVVNKYSGIAGFAFEDVAAMLVSGVLQPNGLPLNSVLGNLVTGTKVGSHKAAFIPPRYGKGSRGYKKSEVRKYEDAIATKQVGEYAWHMALDTSVKPDQSTAQVKALTDSLVGELLALGAGEEQEQNQALLMGSEDSIFDSDSIGAMNLGNVTKPADDEVEFVMPEQAIDDEVIIDTDTVVIDDVPGDDDDVVFDMPPEPSDEPDDQSGQGGIDKGKDVGRLIL